MRSETKPQFFKKRKGKTTMFRGCTRSTKRICIECNNLSNGWETRATVRCILINNTGSYYTTLRIPCSHAAGNAINYGLPCGTSTVPYGWKESFSTADRFRSFGMAELRPVYQTPIVISNIEDIFATNRREERKRRKERGGGGERKYGRMKISIDSR